MPIYEPEPHTLSVGVCLAQDSENGLRSTLDAVPLQAIKLRRSEGLSSMPFTRRRLDPSRAYLTIACKVRQGFARFHGGGTVGGLSRSDIQ